MTVSLVLDTDIGSDVDDALALAFALRHPAIELVAVTTVSGDAGRRAQIAAKLLRLAGREDVEVAVGLDGPSPPPGRSVQMGHEGEGLLEPGERLPVSSRDGVTLIVDVVSDGRCVATIGPQTNMATALARDPGLVDRIGRLAIMGGMLAPAVSGGERLPPGAEHNLSVDPDSAVAVLGAGFDVLLVPLDVTIRTSLRRAARARLHHGDALCRALGRLVDRWEPVLRSRAPALPADHVAFLHDPLTVAALAEPGLVTVERLPMTATVHGGAVCTVVDPGAGHPTDVVTAADAEALEALWLETVLGG